MNNIPRPGPSQLTQLLCVFMATLICAAPVWAQQPTATTASPAAERQPTSQTPQPTFDTLLAAETYKIYGEVRNLGQLLSTGGAGEIVDPIMKLADPPKEFKSIVKFLKANSEALASSRLLFATSPARAGLPNVFVAIEFATPEDAAKFAPKLETFLPTVLPPVPAQPEEKPKDGSQPKPTDSGQRPTTGNSKDASSGDNPATSQAAESLPFVITHKGSLVFITDKPFKLEKIHPSNSRLLAEDQNFRIAHDRFSSEPIFIYFNIALEERSKPQTQPTPSVTQEEAERLRQQDTDESPDEPNASSNNPAPNQTTPDPQTTTEQRRGVLVGSTQAMPEPTPNQAQQSQTIGTNQAGRMLDFLGVGEPQWPQAIGLALALDNSEYVIRAILIDAANSKRLPLPFIPQLISGPSAVADAPSVLPDDTEVFVSASIDLAQTYEGMRQQAESKARTAETMLRKTQAEIPAGVKDSLDPFGVFEKKAGFKIKEDLLPALGNEIAIAGSLKVLQGTAGLNLGIRTTTSSPEPGADKDKSKQTNTFPIILVAIKDRDAAARLIPQILNGLGMGEVNLLAQREKRDDAEIVSYAGMFANAFVGNFLAISDAATVRHVVDANVNHQTLTSNSAYRNSSRWQPRQNLGQIYISPALMESYQQEVRKQAATMDPAMRDFIMRLAPGSAAITYVLSNDGLGSVHELHLPKDLIIAMVAGISSTTKNPPPEMNEAIAMGMLQMIAGAEMSYKTNAGNGSYASLDQLVEQKLVTRDMFDKYGYKIDVTVSGNEFQAVAIPVEYGMTGKRSFFIDQSNVLRGDDHGGGPATIADKPVTGQ